MNDTSAPKSMELFFIDNQGNWPEGAKLVGDFVVWADHGKYPTMIPVAAASHPNYDGKVVVQAGNRSVLVTFCPGAQSEADVRKSIQQLDHSIHAERENPRQFRIAVDAIIHRLVLGGAVGTAGDASAHELDDRVHPFTLLAWLAKAHPKEAEVLRSALKMLMRAPEPITFGEGANTQGLMPADVYENAEAMLTQIDTGLAKRSVGKR